MQKAYLFKTTLWLQVIFAFLALQPGSLLVNGQLEAVSAVFSVVPVTSILATAGLVGVKLAALSRLLQVLGYDQAYLANGGVGTAAQPIGLQTNYAYMFPYVPGLNISVKGESSTHYENTAAHQRDPQYQQQQQHQQSVSQGPIDRKTYPAMGLPGDYESQNRPFRGSEMLRDIFNQAGIAIRIPTAQQQKLLNAGHMPGQGNVPIPAVDLSHLPSGSVTPLSSHGEDVHHSFDEIATAMPSNYKPAHNNQQNNPQHHQPPPPQPLPQSPPPPPQPQPQPQPQSPAPVPQKPHAPANQPAGSSNAHLMDQHPAPMPPKPVESQIVQPVAAADSPDVINNNHNNNAQASSSSFPAPEPPSHHQPQSQPPQQQPPNQPSSSQQLRHPQTHQLALNSQVNMPHPHYYKFLRQPPGDLEAPPIDSAHPTRPAAAGSPTAANVVYYYHYPIPQHDTYRERIRQSQSVPKGHLSEAPGREIDAIMNSFATSTEQRQQQQQQASQKPGNANTRPSPLKFTTNINENPQYLGQSPPYHDEMDAQLSYTPLNRRKKRDTSAGNDNSHNNHALRNDAITGETANRLIAMPTGLKQENTGPTFGMPAANIHSLRRRRRRSLAEMLINRRSHGD